MKDLESCPLRFPVPSTKTGVSADLIWCLYVTAEGASAIPKEYRRVLGVTESVFHCALKSTLLQ